MREIFDNIKQQYRFIAPCPELSGCIEYFWESVGDAPFSVQLFPSFTPTMSFNFGSPYCIIAGNEKHPVRVAGDVLHFRSTVCDFRYMAGSHKFGVKFLPGGLGRLFDVETSLTVKNFVPLSMLLPVTIIRQVKGQSSFEERTAILQEYLFRQSMKSNHVTYEADFINRVVSLFEISGMEDSNETIASKMYTSTKTISRYFTRIIGAAPKQYLFTLRARAALTGYVQQTIFNPISFGYYDHSHFCRDVHKFTGQKLSGL